MWGYIASFKFLKPASNVPSLYVRVYHLNVDAVEVRDSSLTVCEGISSLVFSPHLRAKFPHCMWGYIITPQNPTTALHVPSLYVRVYHTHGSAPRGRRSSLTVCEGISRPVPFLKHQPVFPHCMWGYIVCQRLGILDLRVPSLYVRVYHICGHFGKTVVSSLTVCEGISFALNTPEKIPRFPHCMWGYIVPRTPFRTYHLVPSLYVRVYRCIHVLIYIHIGSLTVCEGISCRVIKFFV